MNGNNVPPEVTDLMAREFTLALVEFLGVPDKFADNTIAAMSVAVRACMVKAVEAAFPPETSLNPARHKV